MAVVADGVKELLALWHAAVTRRLADEVDLPNIAAYDPEMEIAYFNEAEGTAEADADADAAADADADAEARQRLRAALTMTQQWYYTKPTLLVESLTAALETCYAEGPGLHTEAVGEADAAAAAAVGYSCETVIRVLQYLLAAQFGSLAATVFAADRVPRAIARQPQLAKELVSGSLSPAVLKANYNVLLKVCEDEKQSVALRFEAVRTACAMVYKLEKAIPVVQVRPF